MTRYLLASWDGGGNVSPELGIAKRLIAAGHTVHVLSDPPVERAARAAGCTFSPWTTAPHKKTSAPEDDVVRDWEFKNLFKMFAHMLDEFVCGPADRFAADTLGVLKEHPADVVLADFAILGAQLGAEAAGLPCVVLTPNINMRPQPGVPPVGPGFLPAAGPLGRLRDAIVGRLGNAMWKKGLPAYNRARTKFGLAPLDDIWSQYDRVAGVCMLTAERFDFPSTAPSANQRYLGPVLDDPVWAHDVAWTPPWPASNTDPLVLVGLSSTYQHQGAALGNVVSALAGMPVRALVTLGPSLGPEAVVSASPNVVVVPTAPHSLVLPQCAAAITHCGHGTTMRALMNGVPLVCMPMGRDQNDTAARVVHHGAGVRIKPTAKPAAIARALETVLREPAYRSAAQRLRDVIAEDTRRIDPVGILEQLAPAGRKFSVSATS